MKTNLLLDIFKPLHDVEAKVVSISMEQPLRLDEEKLSKLRYILSFARLTKVRDKEGTDHTVYPFLTAHRRWVEELFVQLLAQEDPIEGMCTQLGKLCVETLAQRRKLLHHFPLDRPSLEEEVCNRQLILVMGGGGGEILTAVEGKSWRW